MGDTTRAKDLLPADHTTRATDVADALDRVLREVEQGRRNWPLTCPLCGRLVTRDHHPECPIRVYREGGGRDG